MEDFDVVVVGAGLSGVAAGHYLKTRCPWARFVILEARSAIGGTWDLFRYPGVRSDSDMFTLGYSFRPWRGETSIADGDAILSYIRETATEEGIDAHIRFNHRVVAASWWSAEARWRLTVERTDTGATVELSCSFLFSCSGYYRYDRGYLPGFDGIDEFAGTIVHPQFWPADLDCAGRRVVVIGSGATAITLVPALAETAGHVTMLQRSPTYVVSLPQRSRLARVLRRVLPGRLGPAVLRWTNAVVAQGFYRLSRRHPGVVRRLLIGQMARQLPPGFDVARHFTPRYDPWDQRLCLAPDGDLFRAIRAGRVSVVTDHIERFTRDGVRCVSGQEIPADIVVTATGLELQFCGGMTLSVDGEVVEPGGRLTYKGVMLEDVPNLAVAIGYTNASWTLKCELACELVCRVLAHMRETGRRVCRPQHTDDAVAPEPLLGLTSGYVQRGAHLFPKQGAQPPWRVHQSFLADLRELRRARLDDGVLVFSDPVPDPAGLRP